MTNLASIIEQLQALVVGLTMVVSGLASPAVPPQKAVLETATSIETLLVDKTAKEKADIKASKIVKLPLVGKYTNSQYGVEVEIQSVRKIEGGIELYARAWDLNGKQLGFVDGTVEIERFIILNPPVLVDDPNGTIVREWTDLDTKEVKQRRLREAPLEAIHSALAHTIKVSAKDGVNIVKGKIGSTTLTVYPDADPESTSVDGRTSQYEVGGVAFATLRAAAGNEHDDTSTSNGSAQIWSGTSSNEWLRIMRSAFLFDTSSLPDDAVISSATFSIHGESKSDIYSQSVGVVSSNPASNTDLVNTDYDIDNWGTVEFATRKTIASWSTAGYNDFSLNSDGINNISKTGISKFGTRISADLDNTAPSWQSDKSAHTQDCNADQSGTDKDPKLVITYTTTAVLPTMQVIWF